MNRDKAKENIEPLLEREAADEKNVSPDDMSPCKETSEKQKRAQKPKKLEEELAKKAEEAEVLAQELAACKDQLLRSAAEFDNFRRRSAKERDALFSLVACETIGAFLPVIDNFERALAAPVGENGESYKKGFELILRQLEEILRNLGVERICPVGEPFDPDTCNAVMHVEDESFGAGTVCEVFGPGYRKGDRMIRHAMVKVAN